MSTIFIPREEGIVLYFDNLIIPFPLIDLFQLVCLTQIKITCFASTPKHLIFIRLLNLVDQFWTWKRCLINEPGLIGVYGIVVTQVKFSKAPGCKFKCPGLNPRIFGFLLQFILWPIPGLDKWKCLHGESVYLRVR